ncbi:unnamed protein product [Caenorhabditis bovis]|uniref:GOLD domain-containing protein n=1 Tax=Caenorhabditis bovis TaxID=2654633 RepID=A0A8S1FEN1_9PELO|nr:unnamed protein product [Caenorhabditis bovis]
MLLLSIFCIGFANGLTTKSRIGDDSQVGRIVTFVVESKLTCFYEPLDAGMNLVLSMRPTYATNFPMQFRLTSPSGDFSDWANGNEEADMEHNATETGDYEICLYSPRPIKVNLMIQFHDPVKVESSIKKYVDGKHLSAEIHNSVMTSTNCIYKIYYSLKFYNQMVVRDEALQIKNSDYIQNYSIVFCIFSILISLSQRGSFLIRKEDIDDDSDEIKCIWSVENHFLIVKWVPVNGGYQVTNRVRFNFDFVEIVYNLYNSERPEKYLIIDSLDQHEHRGFIKIAKISANDRNNLFTAH